MKARHGAAVVAVTVLALTGFGVGSAAKGAPTVIGSAPANGSSSSSATTTTSVTPEATTSVTPKATTSVTAKPTTSVTPGAQHPEDATTPGDNTPNDKIGRPGGNKPTQPSATLRETCSQVEKALRGMSFPPTAPELDAALARIKLLSGAGDTETKNTLSALLKALPGYRDEDPAAVPNGGRRAFLNSLTKLADRCEAVGSSSLQWVG